ncbi:uncharacterized protein [Palaemon carinicauda]|uniref:uncharacterized protein n=1 Tax=Palaemon carinicauda TaxID=392227 RepID=UPI0035B5C6E9
MSRTVLHEAAFSGDVDAVRRLLDSDFDINCRNRYGETPLHLASFKGNVAVIRLLLEKGALINARKSNEETPLHRAINNHHRESVEVLLSNGSDVNAQDEKGRTPLHLAVIKGNVEITHLLLREKPKLDLRNYESQTPLHYATIKRNHQMMKILIKERAKLDNLNNTGNTGAHHAAFNGHRDTLEILLEAGFKVNFPNIKGNTLLHLAAREGHEKVVDLLINKGAEVDVYNKRCDSPVLLAAALGYSDIVVKLLSLGANPRNPDTGYSVLHAAAANNRIHTLQAVMTKFSERVPIDAPWRKLIAEDVASIAGGRDSFWWLRKQTQFHGTPESQLLLILNECRSKYEENGSAFIKRGRVISEREASNLRKSIEDGQAEMHYMDQKGNTILHVAMKAGNESVADSLIESGALVTARNHAGQTPADVAEKTQKYSNVRKPDFQDCRYDAFLHSLLLSVIAQTVGLEVDGKPRNYLDRSVQELKLEIAKIFSKLMSSALLYDPVGSCGSHILPLAITTNNRILLPMILSSGCPLTTSDSGLGIVQLAWLTPDITSWVAMVVTRAVINQLKSDLEKLLNVSDMDSHSGKLLLKLCEAVRALISDLEGPKPWEAEFQSPDGLTPTQLLVTASRYGATLTAWYIWRAGANNFERAYPYSKCNALEAALSNKCYSTAFRLVVDMGANPFLMNKDREVSIDIFPDEMRLLEVMLGKDYRILEKKMEKSKDENEKRKLQQITLTLIVLFLQYKLKPKQDTWKCFLRFLLDAHSRIKEEELSCPSTFWMVSLEKILLEEAEVVKWMPVERYPYLMSDPLNKALKRLDLINEDDHFCSLFHVLYTNFSDPQCPWHERKSSKYFTSSLESLFQKGMKYACEEEAPLILHLLISVAGMSFDMVLDDLCKTVPLHHAALKGSISAVVYLLECGASPSVADASGVLPVQYAFMFGHKSTANMLINHSKVSGRARIPYVINGCEHLQYLDFHNSYLRLYGLDPKENVESRHCHVQSKDVLLDTCFRHIENEWRKKGVEKAVNDALVDFQNGEAREIKTSVTDFLSELNANISQRDRNLEGEIQLVGSSEDNLRLNCPDEYDCNLILSNIRASPTGEVKADLVNLDYEKAVACGHQKKLEVQVLKEELKGLIDGTEFMNRFYNVARQSLMTMNLNRNKLKIMMPGIKKTQVGVQMFFLWTGKTYPMLFVNIDFVPTVKAPWPDNLPKPNCGLCSSSLNEIYLNKIDEDEWRLSFGSKETMIMQKLPKCKRNVFLVCKTILAALKTENWVPHKIKDLFKYWDSRMFSLPSKGGFALKNCFFQELEEVTEDEDWSSEKLLKRACSIFERMCSIGDQPEASIDCPKPVKAYFGGDTEKASVFSCAPEILNFLRNFDKSLRMHQKDSQCK